MKIKTELLSQSLGTAGNQPSIHARISETTARNKGKSYNVI